jgi:dTDP-4-amino-4,6-dideoxygalactose transaminase
MEMFRFYLRQTVPFTISDIPLFFQQFFSSNSNLENLSKKEVSIVTKRSNVVFASSMRSTLLKSLEFFRLKLPSRNEILLPEYSFHSNLSCAIKTGFVVKFIPVDQKTLLIDKKELSKLISKKTLGIIITHVHGKIYDLSEIKDLINKNKLVIFEDCAHSFGIDSLLPKKDKKSNSESIKCLSFGPGKFTTSFGGGALATNNDELSKFVEDSLIKNESLINDLTILLKACLYTIISQPFFSYLIMKPALALTYMSKGRKIEADLFDKTKNKPKFIYDLSNFQKKLLLMQLTKLSPKVNKIILKRKEIAKKWFSLLKNKQSDQDFCFQFPILVDDIDGFIWQMWRQNIDVQKDYCTYLPELVKNKTFSQKKSDFFEKIIYLPTNQYLSNKKIKESVI